MRLGARSLFIAVLRDITEGKRAEEALRLFEERFRLVLEGLKDHAVFLLSLDGRVVTWNAGAERIQGYAADEIVGQNFSCFYPDDEVKRGAPEHELAAARDGSPYEGEGWRVRKDGSRFWAITTLTALRNESGKVRGFALVIRDITERQEAQEALRQAQEKYHGVLEQAVIGSFETTPGGRFIRVNPALARLCGYESPAEMKKRITDIGQQLYVEPERRAQFVHLMREHTALSEFESRVYRKDGSIIWINETARAVRDVRGALLHYEGMVEDVTKRKAVEIQLLHDAFHDKLTGLPNRALCLDRVGQSIARAQRSPDYLFAVLLLDLDRFKVVNDSLGPTVGDRMLVEIARRLEQCLRPSDTVSRLGGDEFALLLDGIKDVGDTIHVAERVQQELAAPFVLGGQEVFAGASIGIALSATGYEQAEDVLRDADIAMHRAKTLGKSGHEMFDTVMHARAVKRLEIETDLRRAIEREEFRVFYQPIVSLETGEITGFEALVRWQHPERGLVSPAEFIPVVEETRLILPLGRWVLRESCRQLKEWQTRFPEHPPLTVAVNLSGRQFEQPDLIAHIRQILEETQLSPGRLKLEITESVIMENADSASALLLQIREMGIELAIDDFGTGYSSLSYLHRFPINALKIDRSFVSRIGAQGENAEIVRTIIALADNLCLDVVAEGVETAEQLAHLRALHCRHGQGYFFSKPIEAAAVESLLVRRPTW